MLLERVLRGRGVRGVTSAAAGKIFGDVIVWRVHARGTMWDTSTSVLVTIMGVNVCVRQLQAKGCRSLLVNLRHAGQYWLHICCVSSDTVDWGNWCMFMPYDISRLFLLFLVDIAAVDIAICAVTFIS